MDIRDSQIIVFERDRDRKVTNRDNQKTLSSITSKVLSRVSSIKEIPRLTLLKETETETERLTYHDRKKTLCSITSKVSSVISCLKYIRDSQINVIWFYC